MTTIKPKVSNAQQDVQKNKDEAKRKGEDSRRFAVVDDFKNKIYDIDGDGKGDLSHGQLCVIHLKQANPDAIIDTYDASGKNGVGHDTDKLYQRLSEIADKGSNFYDGVSLSQSAEYDYSNANGLNPNNVGSYKDQLKSEFQGTPTGNVINKLEQITANGTPVYTSSGNKSNVFDLYSTANGVTTVEAEYIEGTDKSGYSSNSLSDKTYNGAFTSYDVIKNGQGIVQGLDITGDGKVDVSVNQLSGRGKVFNRPSWLSSASSSIATPRALGQNSKSKPKSSQGSNPFTTGTVVESQKQKDQQKFENEYNNNKNKIKNPDLEDDIKIDDSIEEWDTL